MEAIFHEKQEGSLCAQHCLNALLQGQYFSPTDLADIASQLDEQERQQMAEAGLQSEAYRRFLEQPSSNYDDSGFFSVQVIDKAVRVWALELVPYNSKNPVARYARQDPTQQKAYICNFREHWLTIRKLGYQWFNLNSLLTGPELISDTYLNMFLTQLQEEELTMMMKFAKYKNSKCKNSHDSCHSWLKCTSTTAYSMCTSCSENTWLKVLRKNTRNGAISKVRWGTQLGPLPERRYGERYLLVSLHLQKWRSCDFFTICMVSPVTGYSIFVVNGELPECEADELLKVMPAMQPIKPRLITEKAANKMERTEEGDEDYQLALAESKHLVENDDRALQKALQMSMEGYIEESRERMEKNEKDTDFQINKEQSDLEGLKPILDRQASTNRDTRTAGSSESSDSARVADPDEVRLKRLAFLNKLESSNSDSANTASQTNVHSCTKGDNSVTGATRKKPMSTNGTEENLTEEEMLKEAIAMSMQNE